MRHAPKSQTKRLGGGQLDLFVAPATPNRGVTHLLPDAAGLVKVPEAGAVAPRPAGSNSKSVQPGDAQTHEKPAPQRLTIVRPVRETNVATGPLLLDVREAARRLGLSKSTLDKMRCSGKGPRFIKATDRAVRYDPVDLDAFAADRRRLTTAQAPRSDPAR